MSILLPDGRDLISLRVVDLKEELERRGLSKTGNKTALYNRLSQALVFERSRGLDNNSSVAELKFQDIPVSVFGNENGEGYLNDSEDAEESGTEASASIIEMHRPEKFSNHCVENVMLAEAQSDYVQPSVHIEQGDERVLGETTQPYVESIESALPLEGVGHHPDNFSLASNGGNKLYHGEVEESRFSVGDRVYPVTGGEDNIGFNVEDLVEEEIEQTEYVQDIASANVADTYIPEPEGFNAISEAIVECNEEIPEEFVERYTETPEESNTDLIEDDVDAVSQLAQAGQTHGDVKKKRKWKSKASRTVTVSSELLKGLVNEAEVKEQLLDNDDQRIVFEDEEETLSRSGSVIVDDAIDVVESEPVVIGDDDDDDASKVKSSRQGPNYQFHTFQTSEENAIIREVPPSPPRQPVTNVLSVKGLTRPFTLPALKQLLHGFGEFFENEFWIDNVKSRCAVKYMDVDAAIKARELLHRSHWPASNPRFLRVDFISDDELNNLRGVITIKVDDNANKEITKREITPKKRSRGDETREKRTKSNKEDTALQRENRSSKKSRSRSPRTKKDTASAKRQKSIEKIWPVEREWDRGKQRLVSSPVRKERDRSSRNERRSIPRNKYDDRFSVDELNAPGKLLDELFRKTIAAPCIYFLPLSESELAARDAQRRNRTLERDQQRQRSPRRR